MKKIFLIALTVCASLTFADDTIKIRDLYQKGSTTPAAIATESEGEYLTIEGYMAPPLEAESQFFVLTKRPMAVCPFCESDADWPDDILAVYTKRIVKVTDFNTKIKVRGKLKIGKFVDESTGFVSMVRLENAVYE